MGRFARPHRTTPCPVHPPHVLKKNCPTRGVKNKGPDKTLCPRGKISERGRSARLAVGKNPAFDAEGGREFQTVGVPQPARPPPPLMENAAPTKAGLKVASPKRVPLLVPAASDASPSARHQLTSPCGVGKHGPTGPTVTVSTAFGLLVELYTLPTVTPYSPLCTGCTLVRMRVELVSPKSTLVSSKYHWYVNGGVPSAITENRTVAPELVVWLIGGTTIVGASAPPGHFPEAPAL